MNISRENFLMEARKAILSGQHFDNQPFKKKAISVSKKADFIMLIQADHLLASLLYFLGAGPYAEQSVRGRAGRTRTSNLRVEPETEPAAGPETAGQDRIAFCGQTRRARRTSEACSSSRAAGLASQFAFDSRRFHLRDGPSVEQPKYVTKRGNNKTRRQRNNSDGDISKSRRKELKKPPPPPFVFQRKGRCFRRWHPSEASPSFLAQSSVHINRPDLRN